MSRKGGPGHNGGNIYLSDRVYDLLLLTLDRSQGDDGFEPLEPSYREVNSPDSSIDFSKVKRHIEDNGTMLHKIMAQRCPQTSAFHGMEFDEGQSCCKVSGKGNVPVDSERESPFKLTHCADQMFPWVNCQRAGSHDPTEEHEASHYARGYSFGQFDMAVMQVCPDEHWSCCNRAALGIHSSSRFKEIVSIPLYRVKYGGRVTDQEGAVDHCQLEFTKPLVALTLVQFPRMLHQRHFQDGLQANELNGGNNPRLKDVHLRRFCHRILGGKLAERGKEPCLTEAWDQRLELFLTLSKSYPAMIKSEFNDFKEMDVFLRKIRRMTDLVGDTSSIVVVGEKALLEGREPNAEPSKKMSFGLLVKLDNEKLGLPDTPNLDMEKQAGEVMRWEIWQNLVRPELVRQRKLSPIPVSDQRAPHGESATFQPGGGTQFIGKSSSRRELGCAPTRTATSRMYS